jgi:hypothetical protein
MSWGAAAPQRNAVIEAAATSTGKRDDTAVEINWSPAALDSDLTVGQDATLPGVIVIKDSSLGRTITPRGDNWSSAHSTLSRAIQKPTHVPTSPPTWRPYSLSPLPPSSASRPTCGTEYRVALPM